MLREEQGAARLAANAKLRIHLSELKLTDAAAKFTCRPAAQPKLAAL